MSHQYFLGDLRLILQKPYVIYEYRDFCSLIYEMDVDDDNDINLVIPLQS